jgi:Zn ribbon nucleic-acid-binding protein
MYDLERRIGRVGDMRMGEFHCYKCGRKTPHTEPKMCEIPGEKNLATFACDTCKTKRFVREAYEKKCPHCSQFTILQVHLTQNLEISACLSCGKTSLRDLTAKQQEQETDNGEAGRQG